MQSFCLKDFGAAAALPGAAATATSATERRSQHLVFVITGVPSSVPRQSIFVMYTLTGWTFRSLVV